jgi:hypothetical protein
VVGEAQAAIGHVPYGDGDRLAGPKRVSHKHNRAPDAETWKPATVMTGLSLDRLDQLAQLFCGEFHWLALRGLVHARVSDEAMAPTNSPVVDGRFMPTIVPPAHSKAAGEWDCPAAHRSGHPFMPGR